jgi:hypothetical protein
VGYESREALGANLEFLFLASFSFPAGLLWQCSFVSVLSLVWQSGVVGDSRENHNLSSTHSRYCWDLGAISHRELRNAPSGIPSIIITTRALAEIGRYVPCQNLSVNLMQDIENSGSGRKR